MYSLINDRLIFLLLKFNYIVFVYFSNRTLMKPQLHTKLKYCKYPLSPLPICHLIECYANSSLTFLKLCAVLCVCLIPKVGDPMDSHSFQHLLLLSDF